MEATSRTPLASISTLAIASPVLILVTRAGIWLRALSCMMTPPRSVIDGISPSRYPGARSPSGTSATHRASQAGTGWHLGAFCVIIGGS